MNPSIEQLNQSHAQLLVWTQIEEKVWLQIDSQVGLEVWEQVWMQLYTPAYALLRLQVKQQIYWAVAPTASQLHPPEEGASS